MLSTVSALSFGWFVSSEIFSCIALYASSNELLSISVPNIFSDISSREIFSILISSDNALIYSTSCPKSDLSIFSNVEIIFCSCIFKSSDILSSDIAVSIFSINASTSILIFSSAASSSFAASVTVLFFAAV